MNDLKDLLHARLFLLDMDGTLYLGDDVFPGAVDFIHPLADTGRQYIYLTNNSSRAGTDYITRLRRLGFPCEAENVFTSGMATALYLNQHYAGKPVYLVGPQAFRRELLSYGIPLVEEGAEIVTGSTHKTFFGPQRGVIGVNYKPEDLKWGLWETIETRAFPGSVSNHHLGTLLGQLMAAYEMNAFKDEYQRAVIENAKSFAASLKAEGLDVAGDPAVGYTETHQVIVRVGYARGPEIAKRLEENNIICNYQATPDEEGFTASGALRMGVNEMPRFGFGREQFAHLAHLIADCILRNADVREEAARLREGFTDMRYCFSDAETEKLISALAEATGN